MATRHGYKYGLSLVSTHGWVWADTDPETYGDRWVVDPVTGTAMSPHQGREVQDARDAESKRDVRSISGPEAGGSD